MIIFTVHISDIFIYDVYFWCCIQGEDKTLVVQEQFPNHQLCGGQLSLSAHQLWLASSAPDGKVIVRLASEPVSTQWICQYFVMIFFQSTSTKWLLAIRVRYAYNDFCKLTCWTMFSSINQPVSQSIVGYIVFAICFVAVPQCHSECSWLPARWRCPYSVLSWWYQATYLGQGWRPRLL